MQLVEYNNTCNSKNVNVIKLRKFPTVNSSGFDYRWPIQNTAAEYASSFTEQKLGTNVLNLPILDCWFFRVFVTCSWKTRINKTKKMFINIHLFRELKHTVLQKKLIVRRNACSYWNRFNSETYRNAKKPILTQPVTHSLSETFLRFFKYCRDISILVLFLINVLFQLWLIYLLFTLKNHFMCYWNTVFKDYVNNFFFCSIYSELVYIHFEKNLISN